MKHLIPQSVSGYKSAVELWVVTVREIMMMWPASLLLSVGLMVVLGLASANQCHGRNETNLSEYPGYCIQRHGWLRTPHMCYDIVDQAPRHYRGRRKLSFAEAYHHCKRDWLHNAIVNPRLLQITDIPVLVHKYSLGNLFHEQNGPFLVDGWCADTKTPHTWTDFQGQPLDRQLIANYFPYFGDEHECRVGQMLLWFPCEEHQHNPYGKLTSVNSRENEDFMCVSDLYGCPEGWVADDLFHKCYLFSTVTTTWHLARGQCLSSGGDLVILDSAEKSQRIIDLIPDISNVYIGATDELQEGLWRWVDGQLMANYTSWGVSQPTTASGENYALANTLFDWSSEVDTFTAHYLCERDQVIKYQLVMD